MNIFTVNKLRINVSVAGRTATISLCGRFHFDAHRELKFVFQKQLENPDVSNIEINMSSVDYLDSSALGMLLILRENAKSANKPLVLSCLSQITQRTFEVAGFYEIFTIN